MEQEAQTNSQSSEKIQDNLAARLVGGLLGSEWKESRERKKKLQRRTVLSDCRLMLRYALDEGCRISDELAKDIAKIDTALIQVGRDPLSEVPPELIQKAQLVIGEPPAPPVAAPESINDVIMHVHNALSDLVTPATAQSLRATDPAIYVGGLPWIAKLSIIGALVCTGFFVYFVKLEAAGISKALSPAASSTTSPTASPSSKMP